MKKNKRYLSLFTLLLVVLVMVSASCITIVEKGPADSKPGSSTTPSATAAPVIKSFTAAPVSVNAGQQSQLSWEISGATRVEINPAVGTVEPISVVLVTPAITTTYTLTATNSAGSSTATVTVTVSSTALNKPDLIVADIWLTTKEVYYKVKNIGGAAVNGGARANLYVNGIKQADDYIEALAPGQERPGPFKNYAWPYSVPNFTPEDVAPEHLNQYAVKVCVDAENVVVESEEANNCMNVIWGQKFNYSFLRFPHLAWWHTGAGRLQLPVPEDNAKGYAGAVNVALEDGQSSGSVLLTCPENVPNGWIKGTFGNFYTGELLEARMAYLKLLDTAKFTARVGFAADTAPNSKARFTFMVEDETTSIVLSREVTATSDGKLDSFDVDLSGLAGKYVVFILRVDALDSAEKIRPVWVDPRVFQP